MSETEHDSTGYARLRDARRHLVKAGEVATVEVERLLRDEISALLATAYREPDSERRQILAQSAETLETVIEQVHDLCARAWGATREIPPAPAQSEKPS